MEIQIRPSGVSQDASLEGILPEIDPETLLVDPNLASAFDRLNRRWTISTRPLTEYLTLLSVRLRSEEGKPLHPAITLELPRKDQVIELDIPFSGEPQPERIANYYRNGLGSNLSELLVAFLSADELISFLQGDADADDVRPSQVLTRALVVYAEALTGLIESSDYFGRPSLLNDRLAMMDRIQLEASPQLKNQISLDRLKRAEEALRRSDHALIRRIWQYSILDAPFCSDRFPLSQALYKHFRSLQGDKYEEMVAAVGINRSTVLTATVQCFRELITIDQETRRALPEVISGPFRGVAASEQARELEGNVRRELQTLTGSAMIDASCGSQRGTLDTEGQLCDALIYLQGIRPRLIDSERREEARRR